MHLFSVEPKPGYGIGNQKPRSNLGIDIGAIFYFFVETETFFFKFLKTVQVSLLFPTLEGDLNFL